MTVRHGPAAGVVFGNLPVSHLHSFIKGQAVRMTATAGTWAACDINNPAELADGIVYAVASPLSFTVTTGSTITFTAAEVDAAAPAAIDRNGAGKLKIGEYYHYNSVGKLTIYEGALYSHPIGRATSDTTLQVFISRPVAKQDLTWFKLKRMMVDVSLEMPQLANFGFNAVLDHRLNFSTALGVQYGTGCVFNATNKALDFDGTNTGTYELSFGGVWTNSVVGTTDTFQFADVTGIPFLLDQPIPRTSVDSTLKMPVSEFNSINVDIGAPRSISICRVNGDGLNNLSNAFVGTPWLSVTKVARYMPAVQLPIVEASGSGLTILPSITSNSVTIKVTDGGTARLPDPVTQRGRYNVMNTSLTKVCSITNSANGGLGNAFVNYPGAPLDVQLPPGGSYSFESDGLNWRLV